MSDKPFVMPKLEDIARRYEDQCVTLCMECMCEVKNDALCQGGLPTAGR